MIPRRNSRYAAQTGGPGSDTDALQTDVMRFMSILGLCLMALFALVQSIPLQDTQHTRLEPEAEKLHQAIAVQQQRAELLQADLNRLTAQLREASGDNSHAQYALTSARQELTRLAGQTEQARSDRDRLTAELNALKRQLAQGRDEFCLAVTFALPCIEMHDAHAADTTSWRGGRRAREPGNLGQTDSREAF